MDRCLLIAVIAPFVLGCGTMANMDGRSFALMGPPDRETQLYGGAANDFRWVGEQAGRVVAPDEPTDVLFGIVMMGYFGLIDLPLSFIGDTLTLPQVIWGSRKPDTSTAHQPDSETTSDLCSRSSPGTR